MVLKLTNKDANFYNYMGKFFGSRIVQTETKDRIYDDNNKVWYIYVDDDNKSYGFISICDNVVKNIYATNETYLIDLFKEIKNDKIIIEPSIVSKLYENIYQKCGLKLTTLDHYKHFVMIQGGK